MHEIVLAGKPAYREVGWGLKRGTENTVQAMEVIDGALLTAVAPPSSQTVGLTILATPTEQSSLVLKAGPGNLFGVCATSNTAGYLMLFDAVAAPANGAVQPKKVWAIGAGGSFAMSCDIPLSMAVGITLVFSSTGPFNKTATPCFMSGEAM